MESPRALLARELPNLIQFGGATAPSVSSERVARATCICGQTSTPRYARGDSYFVGYELGLTTRVARHIHEPVAKALSLSNMLLKFGELQALTPNPLVILDIALAIFGPEIPPRTPRMTLVAAGELKTWWTVNLGDVTVRSSLNRRAYLEPYVETSGYTRVLPPWPSPAGINAISEDEL
ncbi:uncharacterized protein N7458_000974 [Penicillium daleae]|uniref:Uncharacterized protein n=1 Tax=Penicillium daleae TaxID=63821 RepID=A0AAD6CH56_9EURO|nr:uncharacterized protein N7458_000974 [Penicillium daleae]KAJ5465288.1 hypothetical protein N7458_000974 [Penicillium daleae]